MPVPWVGLQAWVIVTLAHAIGCLQLKCGRWAAHDAAQVLFLRLLSVGMPPEQHKCDGLRGKQ